MIHPFQVARLSLAAVSAAYLARTLLGARPICFLAAAIAVGLAPRAAANWWLDPSYPEDSPFWWTLTDDLTPRELRAVLRDPGKDVERYLERHPSLPESLEPDQILVFLDGKATPDLVPMWLAFEVLAHRLDRSPAGIGSTRSALVDLGVTAPGRDAILTALAGVAERVKRLRVESVDRARELRLLLEAAGRSMEAGALEQALRLRASKILAGATARAPEEVRRILEEALRSPEAEAAFPALRKLGRDLDLEDWDRLRSYLLETTASGIFIQGIE